MKFRPSKANLCFLLKPRRNLTSCPLPVEETPVPVPAPMANHKDNCFLLAEQLVARGLFSSAQKVIQRIIISCCSSESEAISAVDFARARGIVINSGSYSSLIAKLVSSGETHRAETLYVQGVSSGSLEPDCSLFNSMIVCYCKLGKIDEAKLSFDNAVRMNFLPNDQACNALIKQFCAQGREFEGYDYFVKISNAGILLDFGCYNRMVNKLSQRGYLDESLDVFDIMCKYGVPPTVNLFKALIFTFCKRGWVEEAVSLSAEMESYGFFMDKVIYTSLIYEYCKQKKMKMALRLFFRMVKMGCEPDNYTYNTLFNGFMNLDSFNKGLALHNIMVKSTPDARTYKIIISKFCKFHKVDSGWAVLSNMIRCSITPTVHCYTVLIAALFKENRLEEVDVLYHEMLDRGLVPDHVLFFTLVKNNPKGCELQLALEFVHQIARNGCGMTCSTSTNPISGKADIIPEIEYLLEKIVEINWDLAKMAFSIYMIALCQGGKLDDAFLCFDKMESHHFLPYLSAYNSWIKCIYQVGKVEDVKSYIEVMQDQGLVPDSATYLIMVNEHCKRGDFATAFDILDQMEERRMRPNVAIYDSIIRHLSRELRVFEIEKLFNRMLEAYVEPDETIYAAMINAYSKSGKAIKALKLFEKMLEHGVRPSSRSYTALINGFIKKNMIEKGCQYADRMMEEGIMPSAAYYTSLINQFFRKKELTFAFRLYDLVGERQIKGDLVDHITLVSGVCRSIKYARAKHFILDRRSNKAKERLFNVLRQQMMLPKDRSPKFLLKSRKEMEDFTLKLMQEMQDSPFMGNLFLYNCLISGYCWAQRMTDADGLVYRMKREGVLPNQVTFTILIDSHFQLGQTNRAVRLYNEMSASGCAPDRILYNTLIRGFCNAGRFMDALSVSYTMWKRGFCPSHASYDRLLCCLRSLLISSRADTGKNKTSCQASYENLLCGQAVNILEDMLGHEYIPCKDNLYWLSYLFTEKSKFHEADVVRDLLLLKQRSSNTHRF